MSSLFCLGLLGVLMLAAGRFFPRSLSRPVVYRKAIEAWTTGWGTLEVQAVVRTLLILAAGLGLCVLANPPVWDTHIKEALWWIAALDIFWVMAVCCAWRAGHYGVAKMDEEEAQSDPVMTRVYARQKEIALERQARWDTAHGYNLRRRKRSLLSGFLATHPKKRRRSDEHDHLQARPEHLRGYVRRV